MISSGIKKEEYREINPYWFNRLYGWYGKDFKSYDLIEFRNGYKADSLKIRAEFCGIIEGIGNPEWGAPEKDKVYIIKLGKIF